MAKVLITPIGVGPFDEKENRREYRNALYQFEESRNHYKTPFVAAAMADELKPDRIIFVGTGGSMWEEVYRYFAESTGSLNEDVYFHLLDKTSQADSAANFDDLDLQPVFDAVDQYLNKQNPDDQGKSFGICLHYGLNDEELWRNFDAFMMITEKLAPGDEIYLDITHSFRSIPLFMYLMMDFLQNLESQSVKLSGLYYGMLDVSKEKGYAPVINLKPLFEISRWIRGTYNFVQYGNGYLIAELTEDEALKKRLKNVTELMQINYLVDLRIQVEKLSELLEQKSYEKAGIIRHMIPTISRFLDRLAKAETDDEFQLAVSGWYFEHYQYGNGYICLFESIITKLCAIYRLDINLEANREWMKGLLFKRVFTRRHESLAQLAEVARTVNTIRKRIAHAAYTGQKGSYRSDIDLCMKHYEKVKQLLSDEWLNELPEMFTLEEIKEKTKR